MSVHRFSSTAGIDALGSELQDRLPVGVTATLSGSTVFLDVNLSNDTALQDLIDTLATMGFSFVVSNPPPQQAGPLPWILPATIPVVAGPYTATSGERVPYDPTAGGFTINAPSAPATEDRFGIKNVSTSANVMTVSGNGSSIEHPVLGTLAASFTLGVAQVAADWRFLNGIWRVV